MAAEATAPALGAPIRIGLLLDLWDDVHVHYRNVADMIADEMQADGRFDRPLAFIEATAAGLPSGAAAEVIAAHRHLCEQNVLAIIGPAIADNALSLRPYAEAARVPTISNTATIHWPGEYCFAVQWGSSADEPYAMAAWLAAKKYKTVGVVIDTFAQSIEYLEHFRAACARSGVEIIREIRIPMLPTPLQLNAARAAVADLRRLNPAALANVGGSMGIVGLAQAIHEANWNIPRICNETFGFLRLHARTEFMDGWVGTSVYDPENVVLQDIARRYTARFGAPPQLNILAALHDTVRAALEGVALALILNPEGVKRGLERMRMIPAAIGADNVLSFGPWDRRAVKGKDIVVLVRHQGNDVVREI